MADYMKAKSGKLVLKGKNQKVLIKSINHPKAKKKNIKKKKLNRNSLKNRMLKVMEVGGKLIILNKLLGLWQSSL